MRRRDPSTAATSPESSGSEAAQRAARKVSEKLEESIREIERALRPQPGDLGVAIRAPRAEEFANDLRRAADALEAAREEVARMEALSQDVNQLLAPDGPYEEATARLYVWLATHPWQRLRDLLGEDT